jgi:hypothetical protein
MWRKQHREQRPGSGGTPCDTPHMGRESEWVLDEGIDGFQWRDLPKIFWIQEHHADPLSLGCAFVCVPNLAGHAGRKIL